MAECGQSGLAGYRGRHLRQQPRPVGSLLAWSADFGMAGSLSVAAWKKI
ncbi:MAG: hypothetical protein LRY66_12190 [Saccharospirillaceae bacterium]|nr:hypothetical protein [Saccharospirillaceae bacterium]